jgi:MacB-like periplasmic core domain
MSNVALVKEDARRIWVWAWLDEASENFFKAIGTPLLRGRFFSIGDKPDAPPVAIINSALARRSWPGHDPVGRRFKLGPQDSDRPWYTVVGVVGDMRRQGLEREDRAFVVKINRLWQF